MSFPLKRLLLNVRQLGAPLRVPAARSVFANQSATFLAARSYSTRNLCSATSRISLYNTTPTLLRQIPTHRSLSLGSIFSRSKPIASPTPQVVAHIARLEAEANVHPHDVAKQLALYEALVETKLKSSYDLIITRWERMLEFASLYLILITRNSYLVK